SAELEKPVVVAGRNVLEPSAPVIWFTYPDRWYDIGLFHLADGTFTGYYANILTPVQMNDDVWHTTDLCLDVWAGADGNVELLDQEEFAEAVERGWMDERCAAIARTTAADLMAAAVDGSWPTREVREWDLARVKLSH
ncbi:MAG TPA: DUF402 domain-containing protein, partial [Longimicrobiaceae bacterium]|nr:DUF402 domain-containing protein [Longimicrobiaceae bacterium]